MPIGNFTQTNNPVATFGEGSQSVSDLQTQLNSQGANLQVDGLFGPLTQAAQNQFQGSSSGTPAGQPVLEPELPVSSFSAPTGNFQSSDVTNAQNAQEDYLNSLSAPNEDQIRRNTLRQFQGQIDSVNSIYADELGRAQVTGQGRLGSQTAINARRGLAGSDFGEASQQGQENANEQVFQSIENERLQKVNFLMGQAQQDASAQIAQKRQAFVEGLDSRLAFYNDRDSRKSNNTSAAVRNLLAQGVDVSELRDNELNQLASFYGISTDDIKNGFASEKGIFESEQAAAEFESRKGELELSELEADIAATRSKTAGASQGGGGASYTQGEYAGIINTILGSGSFTKQQRADVINSINNGEDPATVIENQAIKILKTEGTALRKTIKARDTFNELGVNLAAFYAAGGDTSLMQGKMIKVANKFGKVKDPELVALATQIQKNLMGYRNAISGTAYSEQEGRDIQNVFPGINKSQELNDAIIKGNLINFDSEIESMFVQAIGSNAYAQLQSLESANVVPDEVVGDNGSTGNMVLPDGTVFILQADGTYIQQ